MSVQFKIKTINQELNHDDDRRLMLFDLALGGHHGNYIRYLIDYWCKHQLPGYLYIVVVPEFKRFHRDLIQAIAKSEHPRIKLVELTDIEVSALNSRQSAISRITRNIQEWDLYCHYAKLLQASHSLLMYLDTSEIPLAIGRESPCPFSGIYFRPSFHYSNFAKYNPSWKDRLQKLREQLTWWRILSHPQLKNIFCLDPYAVEDLAYNSQHSKVTYLPDPLEIEQFSPQNQQLKQKTELKIESGRTVFLLFGALDSRKGIYQLLDAIPKLPANLCQKLCLLIVGGTNDADQSNIKQKLKTISINKPVQIIERYEFIPDAEVIDYFQLADVVLATYQKHVGMSGILLLAAAAGKPVLSSDYGLMGEIVRRNELGLSIDSTVPDEIVQGLTQYLTHSPAAFGDRSKMHVFAQEHSNENYVKTIFKNIDY